MAISKTHRSIILILLGLMFLPGCAELLEGPFNQGKNIVPSLLYANNDSDYVTYWDDDAQAYRTYDQENNVMLAEALYEYESNDQESQNFMIAGLSVAPLTRLDVGDMQIQAEQGCVACHGK